MAANMAPHEHDPATIDIDLDPDDELADDEPLLVIDLRDDEDAALDDAIDLDEVLPEDAGVIAKICMLDDLVREGVITDADRARKKAELLGRR